MSWLYSQALAEAFLEENSWDGEPCAQLNVMPTQHRFLRNGKTMDASNLSRFGLTCAVLTESLGADVLTWFRGVFLARTSAQPEKAQELTESGLDCGEKWHESFAKYDHDTHSWKTPQCSLLGDLDEYSEIWPKWGMMQNGVCSERMMSERRTEESESGLWPTPRAQEPGRTSQGYGIGLAELVEQKSEKAKLWPTPNQRDWKDSGPTQGSRKSPNLGTVVHGGSETRRNFATPQARDFRTGSKVRWENPERTRNLNDQIGGQLNPSWVTWLMGWPIGWCELKSKTLEFYEWKAKTSGQNLQALWSEIQQAEVSVRKAGRLPDLSSKAILFFVVCELQKIGAFKRWVEVSGEEETKRLLRSVWFNEESSCPSQRREYSKQRRLEYRNALRKLSCETPSRDFVPRVTEGAKHRTDRLKAIGNGQVPLVAATAWRILTL